MLDQLQKAGFKLVGEWQLDGDKIKLTTRPEAGRPTVYVFVLNGEVVYVGKTETCLRSRMSGYRNGKATQRTNIRIRGRILEELKAAGSHVEVFAVSPEPSAWHGLPVFTVAGLEAGLIYHMKPIWNLLNNRECQ
jgi:hypothetical protein